MEEHIDNIYTLKDQVSDYEDLAIIKYKHHEKMRWKKYKLITEHIEEYNLRGSKYCH